MADLNDVRDELFKAAERIAGRNLTPQEKDKLIEYYNDCDGSDIYRNCRKAIEKVFNIELGSQELLEKTASVDRALMAIKNLKKLSSQSVKRRN